MKSLQEQYGNTTAKATSAVNTTQNSNMEPTIVSLTLHTNVTCANEGVIPEAHIAAVQSRSKGALINTRSAGFIRFNTSTNLVYADFYAVLKATVDRLGKYNCPIWEAEMSDGSKKFLTHDEGQALWGMIFLMLDIPQDSTSVKVKFDFPTEYNGVEVNGTVVDKWIRSGQFRSYSLHFVDISELFKLQKTDEYGYTLRPSEKAVVNFSRNTVQFAEKYAGFSGLTLSQLNAPKAKSPVATMVANQTVIPANTAAPIQVQAATAIADRFDSAPVAVEAPAPVFTGFVRGSGYADEVEAVAPIVVEETAVADTQEAVAKTPSRARFAPKKAVQETEEVSADEAAELYAEADAEMAAEEAQLEEVAVADESVEETGSAATEAAPEVAPAPMTNSQKRKARKTAEGTPTFH